jgi:hypothetical protein
LISEDPLNKTSYETTISWQQYRGRATLVVRHTDVQTEKTYQRDQQYGNYSHPSLKAPALCGPVQGRAAGQQVEQQRMANFYARQTKQQEERENAEARERFAALQRKNRF